MATLLALFAVAVGIVLVAYAKLQKPLDDRDWRDHLSRVAQVETEGERFRITPVKDWSYGAAGATARDYREFSASFDELSNIWFLVEPSETSDLMAHTLLLFEFEGERLVGISVEARLERGETYSPFRGIWNNYELFYSWGTARDLLTTRAVFLKHDIYLYPLRLSDEQRRRVLGAMLETTQKLAARPRFYNTLFSNCTNELAKRAGIPWHYTYVLTGRSAEYLHRRGLIPAPSFAEARTRAAVAQTVRELNALDPARFDAALLAALRAD